MWSVTHPSNHPAESLLSFCFRRTDGTSQGCSEQLCVAFPPSGHRARLFQPAHPAASLPPPAFAACLSLGRTAAVPHGYTRPSGRGDQRPGRVSAPSAGNVGKGGAGAKGRGSPRAPPADGDEGGQALPVTWREEAATDPKQFLLRFLSPAERTVRTAPALWPGINLSQ